MGGILDKGNDSQVVTQRAEIPAFLRPYLTDSADTASSALRRLRGAINSGGSFVSPFNDIQSQAFDLAARRAMGESGFFPAAQDQLYQTALGRDISSILPDSALSGLGGFGGLDYLPPDALGAISSAAAGGAIPSQAMDAFTNASNFNLNPTAVSALTRATSGDLLPASSREALNSTASGDYLYGGPGFDQAVQSAVRAATPGILSTFKNAGVGGATGGLAQAAIGKAAVDAFANQYGQERQNQLSAASLLGDFGLSNNAQQLGAAQSLANLGISEQSQRLAGAGGLADLGLSGQAQRLAGGTALADIAGSERNRQLQAGVTQAGLLGGLADSERARAIQSAVGLPGLATADIDLLSNIGGMQQQQAQRELTGPIDMQRLLLQLSQGAPLTGTIGSSTTTPMQSNAFGNALGGALGGFEMFGPWGAVGGGLLGLLGS